MSMKKLALKFAFASVALLGLQTSSYAVDSTSVEVATGAKVQMLRLGAQWDWKDTAWFKSNGTQLSGYWDLSVAEWRQERYLNTDSHKNFTDIGFTPVFRFQRDDKKGFYAEGGVGVHLFSSLYNNNGKKLSTAFQFGDHIGGGYVFANGVDVGLKLQHFSNGGIKQPNGGVNFVVLKAAYHF
jgi:lipid A 3-O-deacylase